MMGKNPNKKFFCSAIKLNLKFTPTLYLCFEQPSPGLPYHISIQLILPKLTHCSVQRSESGLNVVWFLLEEWKSWIRHCFTTIFEQHLQFSLWLSEQHVYLCVPTIVTIRLKLLHQHCFFQRLHPYSKDWKFWTVYITL